MTPTRYFAALATVVALVVLAIGADAGADMSDCKVAQIQFSDCVTYVLGADKEVSPQCCAGLGVIMDTARTGPELRSLCACLLSEMVGAEGNLGLAADIPVACGHPSVPFLPTSPDFDCSRIPPQKWN